MPHPIILLHGALGSQQQLSPLKAILSDQFEVYDLNFAGHAGMPIEQPYSMELFANNVLTLMQDNKLSSAHFFGYSMGGYVALHLARHQPQAVRKIVTLATKFDWTPETATREVKMLDADKIQEKVPKFAASLEAVHQSQWKAVLRHTAEMMQGLGNGHHLSEEDFRQIQQQVLINIGDADRMVSIAESQRSSDFMPNASLSILEGVPHPIERVDQERLAQIITQFIHND